MILNKTGKRSFPGLVVGIGNFDGVHLGHRRIIAAVRKLAGREGTAGIITFNVHTRRSLNHRENKLLTTLEERLELFREEGVEVCWVREFTPRFSRLTPKKFVEEVLVRELKIVGLCFGEGFRFGKDRRGGAGLLRRAGEEYGFRVREVPTLKIAGEPVSSSAIRDLVRRGEVKKAARRLGRDYSLSGKVVRGSGRGKEWGYPTANFFPEQLIPAAGVYASEIELASRTYPGMLYLGTRPTFSGGGMMAEAHIFGRRGGLYRRRIKVFLKKRVRGDIKFDDSAKLLERIRKDEALIKRILRRK